MSWDLRLVQGPSVEPVSVGDVKALGKIDYPDDDQVIEGLIVAARERLESWTGLALMTQTWELALPRFPWQDRIFLPKPAPRGISPRIASITSITYYDTTQAAHTMTANTDFYTDLEAEPAEIVVPFGKVWPTTVLGTSRPVVVRFVTGVSDPAALPMSLLTAMKMMVIGWLDSPSPVTVTRQSSLSEVPLGMRHLIEPHVFRYPGPYKF